MYDFTADDSIGLAKDHSNAVSYISVIYVHALYF